MRHIFNHMFSLCVKGIACRFIFLMLRDYGIKFKYLSLKPKNNLGISNEIFFHTYSISPGASYDLVKRTVLCRYADCSPWQNMLLSISVLQIPTSPSLLQMLLSPENLDSYSWKSPLATWYVILAVYLLLLEFLSM